MAKTSSCPSKLTSVREERKRSIVKAISWRTVGTIDTFILTFLITGHLRWALSVSGVELITKMVLYYLHERAWNKISFGCIVPVDDFQI